jgi:hypothetical protein
MTSMTKANNHTRKGGISFVAIGSSGKPYRLRKRDVCQQKPKIRAMRCQLRETSRTTSDSCLARFVLLRPHVCHQQSQFIATARDCWLR